MTHTVREKQKLLARVRRIRGQVEAIERSLEAEAGCEHLWRLGPRHLGAIVSVMTSSRNGPEHYKRLLGRYRSLSHVTIEVLPSARWSVNLTHLNAS